MITAAPQQAGPARRPGRPPARTGAHDDDAVAPARVDRGPAVIRDGDGVRKHVCRPQSPCITTATAPLDVARRMSSRTPSTTTVPALEQARTNYELALAYDPATAGWPGLHLGRLLYLSGDLRGAGDAFRASVASGDVAYAPVASYHLGRRTRIRATPRPRSWRTAAPASRSIPSRHRRRSTSSAASCTPPATSRAPRRVRAGRRA